MNEFTRDITSNSPSHVAGVRLLPRREGDDIDNALSEQFEEWLPAFWEAYERRLDGGKAGKVEGGDGGRSRRLERMLAQGERDAKRAEEQAAERSLAVIRSPIALSVTSR